MFKEKISKYLKSIGKSVFINHFDSFKDNRFPEEPTIEVGSKDLRQRFANFIFVNNLEIEALELCIESKISASDKEKATSLINTYKSGEPFSEDFMELLQASKHVKSNDDFLLKLLNGVHKELQKRNMIRSKNIVGDLAEYYVMSYFNKNKNLPDLEMVTQSNRGYDLIDKNNKRYQVKGITQYKTSNFHISNIEDLGFDYIIVAKLDDNFLIEKMYILDAIHFDSVKMRRKGTNTYYININNRFKQLAKELVG